MDLKELFYGVKKAISSLDFDRIWPGFTPLKFALYDNEKCFFDGAYVEKTPEFCANTAIEYKGEQIAIWNVMEELEIPVMTSKMVHEMFHGFQNLSGWNCGPNEMEALARYEYSPENLSMKLRENELLLSLLERFDEAALRELMGLRKLRSIRHPYEFSYESCVEEIEGTANYVEWQVLKQLDGDEAAKLKERMRAVMTKPEYLFPIRISCYFAGAMMISALQKAGLYSFDAEARPFVPSLLCDFKPCGEAFTRNDVSDAVAAFTGETKAIVENAIKNGEVVLEGPYELMYVNVYNARSYNGFITSTYFMAYVDGGEMKMLYGNFVIGMRDEITIDRVYRWI